MIQDNIKGRLAMLRKGLRECILWDGLARTFIALIVGILAVIFLDYFFFRTPGKMNWAFRLVLSGGLIATMVFVIRRYIVKPLSTPLSIDDMALAVEREFPNLNDSLISTIQLTQLFAQETGVSHSMIEEVARRAHEEASKLDFGQVVKRDRLKPFLGGAAGSVVVLLALLLLLPGYMGAGLFRLVTLSNYAYPVRTFISIPEKHMVCPRREPVMLVVQCTGSLPSYAEIAFMEEGKTRFDAFQPITTRQLITRDDGTKMAEFTYEYAVPDRSFRYLVRAGDNRLGDGDVERDQLLVAVVDRPDLVDLQVVYEQPTYIGATAAERSTGRELRNVAGTVARITGRANKPIRSARIMVGDGDPERDAKPMTFDGETFTHSVKLAQSGSYEIFLTSTDGFSNGQPIRHRVVALPDHMPKVRWTAPAQNLEVTPSAVVPLALALEDDWGLQRAEVKYKIYKGVAQAPGGAGAGAQAPQPDTQSPAIEGLLALPEEGLGKQVRRQVINTEWALATLALQPGDVVVYHAEAFDYCPETGRKGEDPFEFNFRVLSREEIKQKLDIERLRLIDDLKAIIRDQETDKGHVDAMVDHLTRGNPFEQRERMRVSDAEGLQQQIINKTNDLSRAFLDLSGRYRANGLDTPDDTARLQTIVDTLNHCGTEPMPQAASQMNAANLARTDVIRQQNLRGAAAKQFEAITELKALLDHLQKWAETEELIRLTRELLLKQQGVTRLTTEIKTRLGAKDPKEANKDEQGVVKGLEHDQRDCSNSMDNLMTRMLAARAKMEAVDKWIAKNITDAIAIAQNTDATPENPNLASTGDKSPGIKDKMVGAQVDIQDFRFGTAGLKQKGAETGLERIITVLSRRKETNYQETLKDIKQSMEDLKRILQQQRDLTEQTRNISEKQELQRRIGETQKQLKELYQRQQDLKKETEKTAAASHPDADRFERAIKRAREELEKLGKDQEEMLKETVQSLTEPEREIARAVHELDDLVAEEEKLREQSRALGEDTARQRLEAALAKVQAARQAQEDIQKVTALVADLKEKDPKAGDEKVKLARAKQEELAAQVKPLGAELRAAADALDKEAQGAADPSRRAAVSRALRVAAGSLDQAPENMAAAAKALAQGDARGAKPDQETATDNLRQAEAALSKAMEGGRQQNEGTIAEVANRQADLRARADEIATRMAQLAQAGSTPEGQKDPKLASAAKAASEALPTLDQSARAMGEATDEFRRGAPQADQGAMNKARDQQEAASGRLAQVRDALQKASNAMAQDKSKAHGALGDRQGKLAGQAGNLQQQLGELAGAISKAHQEDTGDKGPQSGDVGQAGQKVGQAAGRMKQSEGDLKGSNPAGSSKQQAKALDDIEEAKALLGQMSEKVAELKDPTRRLERSQKDLKEKARDLAKEIGQLEKQLEGAPKPGENVQRASNNMQNAENALSQGQQQGGQQQGGQQQGGQQQGGQQQGGQQQGGQQQGGQQQGGQQQGGQQQGGQQQGGQQQGGQQQGGQQQGGQQQGGQQQGGQQQGGQQQGGQQQAGQQQGGQEGPDRGKATKEQEHALSELEQALKQLDELAKRAAQEKDPRLADALKKKAEAQRALREEVERLRPKLDKMADQTGARQAQNARQSTESASRNQSQASSQMGQGQQSGAVSSQEEAEQDLQEALDNLQQMQQQMQNQSQQEELFQIEQEVNKMLAAQKSLLQRTQQVESQRPGPEKDLPRRAKIQCNAVQKEQGTLAQSAGVVVKRLEEAPVFQWVLQTATDDMNESAQRLDKEESGPLTQEIQEDVIRKLSELVDALRKERKDKQQKQQQGGGGGGGGGGKQPLVPPLAELKMLRIMQRDVNVRTKRVDEKVSTSPDKKLTPELKESLRRAAQKEGDISRITEKMAKQLEAGGGG